MRQILERVMSTWPLKTNQSFVCTCSLLSRVSDSQFTINYFCSELCPPPTEAPQKGEVPRITGDMDKSPSSLEFIVSDQCLSEICGLATHKQVIFIHNLFTCQLSILVLIGFINQVASFSLSVVIVRW